MFDAREDIINFFKRGTFPYKGDVFKAKEESEESEEKKSEKIKDDFKKFIEYMRMNQRT